jgi:hypothetical protein
MWCDFFEIEQLFSDGDLSQQLFDLASLLFVLQLTDVLQHDRNLAKRLAIIRRIWVVSCHGLFLF